VDPDEDPGAAAVRETAEETGIRISITGLIGLFHRPDPEGLADIVIAYRAEPLDDTLCAGDDADDAGWFSGPELDGLPIALATTRRLLTAWRAGTL
jgi:acetyl-CoA carboxylase carboxyl transferase subunit beta